jgi:purine-binding chemotaxis protein CheW
MNSKNTDSKPLAEADESVQDYLDLLLTRATEDPAAQVDVPRAANVSAGPQTEDSSLVDYEQDEPVTEAAPKRRSGDRRLAKKQVSERVQVKNHSGVTAPEAQRTTKPTTTNAKPFAEPIDRLTVKKTLPEVKSVPVDDAEVDTSIVESRPQVSFPRHVITQDPSKLDSEFRPATKVVEGATSVIKNETPSSLRGHTEEVVHSSRNIAASEWLPNGRPAWAQEHFECLLFTVGGLTLAVPLAELGTIYPYSEDVTPLFGQIDWFLGLMAVKDTNVRVVNTAKVVMPERYQEAMKDGFNNVISIHGVDWGLAVDSVSDSISLNPDDVRWRGQRSKRPWLAGTVVEHMCALLDVSQLAKMFSEHDRKRNS